MRFLPHLLNVALLLALSVAAAQIQPQPPKPPQAAERPTVDIPSVEDRARFNAAAGSEVTSMLPAQLIIISVSGVAVAGMLVVVALGFSPRTGHGREGAIRTIAVVFIVYAASLLALVYGHTETVTAVASLLSATIGYLYGRSVAEAGSRTPPDQQAGVDSARTQSSQRAA